MKRIVLFALIIFVAVWIIISMAVSSEHDFESAQGECSSAAHWDTVTIGDTVYNCKSMSK